VQAPVGHRYENPGILAGQARRGQALVGRALGEAHPLHAEGLHAGIALRQVEPALVDLGDPGEDHGERLAIVRDALIEVSQQGMVAEVGSREGIGRTGIHGPKLQRGLGVISGGRGAHPLYHAHF